jgi:aldose 1-epimerase
MLTLSQGDLALQLAPELGGTVCGFTYRGCHVLRPTLNGAHDPLEAAAFALVPYANRIAKGSFQFGGRAVRIAANAPGETYPLHGQGWREPWDSRVLSDRQAVLSYMHDPDGWPWSYAVEQAFTLNDRSLRIDLTLRNTCDAPMPAGLGWHPYFPRRPGARLRAGVRGAWLVDEEGIPTSHIADARLGDWSRGESIERNSAIDHCLTGWSGLAQIDLPAERLAVTIAASDAMRWLHVYIPSGRDFFCVEPVSHMPNAVNRAEPHATTGMTVLEPGASLAVWIEVGVREAPADQ